MLNLNYNNVNYDTTAMNGHRPKNEAEIERGYTTGPWKNINVFRCCLCPDSSADELHIQQHVFTRHHTALPPEERPASTLLFGASGEVIEKIPVSADAGTETLQAAFNFLDDQVPALEAAGVLPKSKSKEKK